MSVRDNMAFGLRLRKMPESEIQQRVNDAARILGLEQLLDRLPKQMSGGQRQRVAMGRAIVREPQAFLMDEPLSNLDAKLRVQMRTEIAKLHQRLGTTTVYVTHDQVEAMTLGHRICILRKGVVQQVDTPYMVYNNPSNVFVGGFIGSPGMNFLTGTLYCDNGSVRLMLGTTSFPLPADVVARLSTDPSPHGSEVIVGIRPEHLHEATPHASAGTLEAKVDLVEALGSEAYAYITFDIGTPDLSSLSDTQAATVTHVARLDVGHSARQGAPLHLIPDLHHVHLFDPGTQTTLLAPHMQERKVAISMATQGHTDHHRAITAGPEHAPTAFPGNTEGIIAAHPAEPVMPVAAFSQHTITQRGNGDITEPHALRVGIASERARAELGAIDPALLIRRSSRSSPPVVSHTAQTASPAPTPHIPPARLHTAVQSIPSAEHGAAAPGQSATESTFTLPALAKPKLFQNRALFFSH